MGASVSLFDKPVKDRGGLSFDWPALPFVWPALPFDRPALPFDWPIILPNWPAIFLTLDANLDDAVVTTSYAPFLMI